MFPLLMKETINKIMGYFRKHGYPPAHCDADGDFKQEKDK